MAPQWTRRRALRLGGAVGIVGVAGCLGSTETSSTTQELDEGAALLRGSTLVTSPSCSCCHAYADVLAESGVDDLATETREDHTKPKQEAGIPRDMWGCHSVFTDEYVIEGHVPLAAVETVATEQPDIAGIALPGMPAGSPGMGGTKDGEFVVYAIERDGSTSEYLRV